MVLESDFEVMFPLLERGLAAGASISVLGSTFKRALPPQIEVIHQPEEALAWADYLALAVSRAALSNVRAALNLQPGLRPGCPSEFLIVDEFPCGIGACGTCPVPASSGWRWARFEAPLLAHILAGSPQETEQALLLLERDERISGAELGLEHPAPDAVERAASLAAASELPVILRLPLDADADSFHTAQSAGAAALSLGPPRGRLRDDSGDMNGRMYGPALFPLALEKVAALAGSLAVPLIASGGLYAQEDLWAFLEAGAAGAQLDGLLWTRPEDLVPAARQLTGHP